MLSKMVLFVSVGIAVGITAGIIIGLTSYPVTTEEKAQASIPSSTMNNQSMQSMDSMSGNQSMMMTNDQLFNPNVPITIPLVDGYYNGSKVFFIHTEVSDEKMAQMMTHMTNFPTLHVPELVNETQENISKVYVFTNGIPGSGPYGGGPFMFQTDVFDSVPDEQGYNNFHVPYLVTWYESAKPRMLTSAEEILQAEKSGELTINRTGSIVNAPIIAWVENGQNQTATSIDTPFKSMSEFNGNVTFVNTDNYVAKLMLMPKSGGDITPSGGNGGEQEFDGSANAVAAARSFLLARLPALGIQIQDELRQLHTDMVIVETETEYRIDFFVLDQNGQSHNGYVEVSNGEVMFAVMDGKSIQ